MPCGTVTPSLCRRARDLLASGNTIHLAPGGMPRETDSNLPGHAGGPAFNPLSSLLGPEVPGKIPEGPDGEHRPSALQPRAR